MEGESPPALDEVEELGDYWKEDTTITVRRYTKAQLDEHRDGRPWDVFLEQLRREHADPLTFNDAEQIAEYLEEQLEPIANSASMAADPGVDGSEIARDINNRIDDLETELKAQIEALQR